MPVRSVSSATTRRSMAQIDLGGEVVALLGHRRVGPVPGDELSRDTIEDLGSGPQPGGQLPDGVIGATC